MKVYLAGKITKNDWRHDLVPGLRSLYSDLETEKITSWQTLPMEHGLEFVGPYFASCDHGCVHSAGEHAWIGGCLIQHNNSTSRSKTARLCRDAIKECDVFFAWMNDGETAHGTLVEIGLAYAYGKRIVLASSFCLDNLDKVLCDYCRSSGHCSQDSCTCSDYSNSTEGFYNPELWFAHQHASILIKQRTPLLAFDTWVFQDPYVQGIKCESPLEKDFWRSHRILKMPSLQGLVCQHKVTVDGTNYRLDFALPDRKIAFEMDGYTYHGKDRTDFNRDRRRDLRLKLAGWEVHRFDGDLIREDPFHVVKLAAKLAE